MENLIYRMERPSQRLGLLEIVNDITAMAQAGIISVTPAMNGTHVVNCPFFEPSTVYRVQSETYR